jgi:hypothetical protein
MIEANLSVPRHLVDMTLPLRAPFNLYLFLTSFHYPQDNFWLAISSLDLLELKLIQINQVY